MISIHGLHSCCMLLLDGECDVAKFCAQFWMWPWDGKRHAATSHTQFRPGLELEGDMQPTIASWKFMDRHFYV